MEWGAGWAGGGDEEELGRVLCEEHQDYFWVSLPSFVLWFPFLVCGGVATNANVVAFIALVRSYKTD